MIRTNNYDARKISLDLLQDKKSRDGKKYQHIPILYDGRKALVHLCGRFQLRPDLSFAVEVDDDNRKLFEDFEKKLQSEAGAKLGSEARGKAQSLTDEEVKLIKYGRVYLKIYLDDEGKMGPKFWKFFEKNGEEYKKAIRDKESLIGKHIEGEIVLSIANIFVGKQRAKSIICAAKEILVREIIEEMSYFKYPVGEDESFAADGDEILDEHTPHLF